MHLARSSGQGHRFILRRERGKKKVFTHYIFTVKRKRSLLIHKHYCFNILTAINQYNSLRMDTASGFEVFIALHCQGNKL